MKICCVPLSFPWINVINSCCVPKIPKTHICICKWARRASVIPGLLGAAPPRCGARAERRRVIIKTNAVGGCGGGKIPRRESAADKEAAVQIPLCRRMLAAFAPFRSVCHAKYMPWYGKKGIVLFWGFTYILYHSKEKLSKNAYI
jgi:hypothetical protein